MPPLFVRLLFIFLATSTAAFAQCTTRLAELPVAPEMYGFRLGMTRDEIKTLVPQTVFGRKDDFGVIKTTINPFFDPKFDQTKFNGVRTISLDLLDDKLTSLWFGYDSTYKAPTIEEFVKLISQSLKLTSPWKSWRSRGMQLKCADFEMIVTSVANGPSFRILQTAAEDTIAARRAAKEADTEEEEIVADKQTKTYYVSGCTSTITEANRVTFKSTEDAEKAGFKLAKNCRPE